MFQVPRNRKFYKERKDNTITREDDGKLFHFRNKSVQWIADFLGNDDEETRGGALSSVMKIKILLRYVADPGIKNKIIHRVINSVKLFIRFQVGVAELMEVSQPIVSNVVKFVTGKIIDKAPLWRLALNGKQLLVRSVAYAFVKRISLLIPKQAIARSKSFYFKANANAK
jgi:hypothetical protein